MSYRVSMGGGGGGGLSMICHNLILILIAVAIPNFKLWSRFLCIKISVYKNTLKAINGEIPHKCSFYVTLTLTLSFNF